MSNEVLDRPAVGAPVAAPPAAPVAAPPAAPAAAPAAGFCGICSLIGLLGSSAGLFDAGGGGAGLSFFALSSLLVSAAGSADASSLPVPSPNKRPQNTPTARPADTTTGTTFDVPRRTGRGIAPIGAPIGGI